VRIPTSGTARLLVAALAVLLLIVACGGGGATNKPVGSTAPGASTGTGGSTAPGASTGTGGSTAPGGSTGPGASTGTEGTPTAGGSMGPGPSFANIGGSVSVLASWTGAEQESFMAMLQPWMDATGVQVNYQGSRSMQDDLTAGIQAGGTGLPDVAGVPGPGLARDWYAAKLSDGTTALKPLDFVDLNTYSSSTPPGMAELGVADDGKLIGIFTKAAVKGLIWYSTKNGDVTAPATFDELESSDAAPAANLWCNAVESGAASGWPGTDWIEDIVIRQSGPDVYDSWVNGQTKWSSPEIKQAWQTFGDVVAKSAGGGTTINATNFGDVGNGLFTDPPTCKYVHQASFITDFFKNQGGAAEGDFDFFVMPDINTEFAGALTGGGDMFGMFHDTPQAQSLMQWLVTPQAQAIWASRGGYIAANTGVPTDVYANDADRKAAAALQNASSFRFDGSDSMPGEMNSEFFKAIVQFVSDPSQLDSILAHLDEIQASAYSGGTGASPGASEEASPGAS
jgi:alpha-glucoside transport system substrate-binding protein